MELDAHCMPQATDQFEADGAAEVITEDQAWSDHQGDERRHQETFPWLLPSAETLEEAEELLMLARTEFARFVSSHYLESEDLVELSDQDLKKWKKQWFKLNSNLSWRAEELKTFLDDPVEGAELDAKLLVTRRRFESALLGILNEIDRRARQSLQEDDDPEEEDGLSDTQTEVEDFGSRTEEWESQDLPDQVEAGSGWMEECE